MVMNNYQLNIDITDNRWEDKLPNICNICQTTFDTAIEYLKLNNLSKLLTVAKPLNINLLLSDNNKIQDLNKEFRNLDKPTNVLSFANIDDPEFEQYIQYEDIIELGDIIIALETMENEANIKQISLQNHLCHLLIHGILHLFGYDHQEDEEAEEMENIEILILQQLNISNPYLEDNND